MIRHRLSHCIAAQFLITTSVFAYSGHASAGDLVAADEYNYTGTFAQYCEAADRGDRNAQRTCGLMALYGETLYGDQVHRNLPLAKKYLGMAAVQGSALSMYMLTRLKANPERHKDPVIGIDHSSLNQ